MTESSLLDHDLAALRDDCRRDPLPVDDTLRRTNMYRDDRLGAEAKRDALRDERRTELALMPLSLSHVFAARVGRAAAGGAALVCVAVFSLGMTDPMLFHLASAFLPGLNLTTCAAVGAVVVLAAYVIASWIAQHVFERRMRLAIEAASPDAHADLDRLAEGPIDIGDRLVRKADGWAIGLGIAGATVVTSMCVFFLFVAGGAASYRYLWSNSEVLAGLPIERNLLVLGAGFVIALVGAVFVAIACANDQRDSVLRRAVSLRFLSHWSALAVGVFIGCGTLYSGLRMLLLVQRPHHQPWVLHRFALVVFGVTALFLVTSWVLLAWRRREEARLAR